MEVSNPISPVSPVPKGVYLLLKNFKSAEVLNRNLRTGKLCRWWGNKKGGDRSSDDIREFSPEKKPSVTRLSRRPSIQQFSCLSMSFYYWQYYSVDPNASSSIKWFRILKIRNSKVECLKVRRFLLTQWTQYDNEFGFFFAASMNYLNPIFKKWNHYIGENWSRCSFMIAMNSFITICWPK